MTSPADARFIKPPPTLGQRWQHFRQLGAVRISLGLACCAHWWLTLSSLLILAVPDADRSVFYAHPLLLGSPLMRAQTAIVLVLVAMWGFVQAHRMAYVNGRRDPARARAAAGYARALSAALLLAATLAVFQWITIGPFTLSWWLVSAVTVAAWVRFVLGVRQWLAGQGLGLERRVQSTRWMRTGWAMKWQARLILGWGFWVVNVPLAASAGAIAANGGDAAVPRLVILGLATAWLAWDTWNFHDEVISRASAF